MNNNYSKNLRYTAPDATVYEVRLEGIIAVSNVNGSSSSSGYTEGEGIIGNDW